MNASDYSSPPNSAQDFQLRFQGNAAERHQLPAEVLASSIEALQKIVHILAMSHEDHAIQERVRVPEKIASRYTVLCDIAVEGSYSQPFHIGALTRLHVQDITTNPL